VSLPTVVFLTELSPRIVPDVVARLSGLNAVDIATVRELLRRFPAESASLMVDRILRARENWHGANLVPSCFTVQHRPFCVDLLASAESGDIV